MANGLNESRTIAFAQRVAAMDQEALGIRVMSGIECDILKDGRMDLDDEALGALDLVVASVHSYMNLSSEEMTDRYLRCLENPYVKVIGHPTGRVCRPQTKVISSLTRNFCFLRPARTIASGIGLCDSAAI